MKDNSKKKIKFKTSRSKRSATKPMERFSPVHTSKKKQKEDFWEQLSKHHTEILIRGAIFLVLVVLVIAFFIVRYQTKVYTTYEEVASAEVMVATGNNTRRFGNSMLIYGNDGAKCVNSKGEVVWNVTYEMQNPVVDIADSVVGIADYNGSKIFMMSETATLGEISTGMPIRSFRVSPKELAIAVLDDANTTPIYIYDKAGEQKAFFSTSMRNSGYPVSLCISDSGYLVGISYLYVDNGNFKSNIAFYNFGEVGQNETDNLVSGYTYANAIVPQMEFVDDSGVIAIADNRLMFYEGTEKPVSAGEVMLQENIVATFYGDDYVALVHNNTEGDKRYRIDIYDGRGQKKDTVYFDGEYKEIFFHDGRIIIYDSDHCLVHKIGGIDKFDGEFNKPVLMMMPTNVSDRFVLVYSDSMSTVELK